MSVIVKGIKMSETCEECTYQTKGACFASGVNKGTITIRRMDKDRPDWCPLVPLPEKHGDLIDKDEAVKRWGLDKATKYGNETAEQQHFSYSTMMMYEIVDILDDAPVIIEAEGEK